MPIDAELAVATKYADLVDSWDADRVILYHLGLGAGARPTDQAELAYVSERSLKVLPTFSVIPGFEAVRPALQGPGLDYHLSRMLHGEQDLVVHTPLSAAAEIVTSACVEAVYDKGKAAVAVLRAETRAIDGTPLCTNRFTLFIRGEGGFGGPPSPPAEPWAPEGEPDYVVTLPTLPQQAAIYRLSGDRNPLHLDPKFAQRAGFERPILHGLCAYGMVCKAVVDTALDGDPSGVMKWSARFAGSVYPGETLSVRMWRRERQVLVDASVLERSVVVLSNACLMVR
jgi:acyl dehydratase